MMDPKDKAKYLVEGIFYEIVQGDDVKNYDNAWKLAKEATLDSINKIIDQSTAARLDYWQQVKEEIQKL